MKLDQTDVYFSRVVRKRAGYRCEVCSKVFAPNDVRLNCSHFIGRSWRTTRWDFDNCDSLCASCHAIFELRKGTDYTEWKQKKLGQVKFDELKIKGRTKDVPDEKLRKEWRKQWRQELNQQ